jgi:hypothetical protein
LAGLLGQEGRLAVRGRRDGPADAAEHRLTRAIGQRSVSAVPVYDRRFCAIGRAGGGCARPWLKAHPHMLRHLDHGRWPDRAAEAAAYGTDIALAIVTAALIVATLILLAIA